MNICKLRNNEIFGKTNNYEAPIVAVSYTHLDVYKRQVPIVTLVSTDTR